MVENVWRLYIIDTAMNKFKIALEVFDLEVISPVYASKVILKLFMGFWV